MELHELVQHLEYQFQRFMAERRGMMDAKKRLALEKAGFRFGDAEDFLGLTEEERRLVRQRACSQADRISEFQRLSELAKSVTIYRTWWPWTLTEESYQEAIARGKADEWWATLARRLVAIAEVDHE